MISLLEKLLKEDEFDSIFQPISKEERFKRLGMVMNKGGTITYKGQTFDPQEKGYPILSHRYKEDVFRVEKLKEIPLRAPAFKNVVDTLSKNGVEWTEFSRIRAVPEDGSVSAGLQAVGVYKDKGVMFETKVGVGTASAGYFAYVGSKVSLDDAGSGDTTVHPSSSAALKWILKKLGLGK